MKNLIKLSILALILVTVSSTVLFYYFMPTEQNLDIFNNLNEQKLEYSELNAHLNGNIQAYFFCQETNQNCIYTQNEIKKPPLTNPNTTTI